MQRSARLPTVLVAMLTTVGLGVFVALRLEVTTDITDLLPDVADRQLAAVSRALADSSLTRAMIVSLSADRPETARAAAVELHAALRADTELLFAATGPDPAWEQATWDVYFPQRFAMASESPAVELPAMLSPTGMAHAAQSLKHQLGLPTAPLVKKLAPADPFLLFSRQLARLEAAQPGGVQVVDGQFVSRDGNHALVFLTTRHSALDAQFQGPFLSRLDLQLDKLRARHGPHLRVQMSGINRFSVKSRADIEADVSRISLVSTVALLALFVVLFRSARLILLAQLPIAFGLIAGAAATIAVFGRVHGLTLAFGSTLIGVCIDYPLHYLNHHLLAPHPNGPRAGVRQIGTGLWLGALTTIVGFAALGASSYPGIRQVAVFATAGVAGALLATVWWLPALVPETPRPVAAQQQLAAAMARLFGALRGRPRLLMGLLVGSLLIATAGIPRLEWHDDVAALNALDPVLQAEDQAVRAQVSSLEPGQVVVVTGRDDEELLQRNDAVFAHLERAALAGDVGSFRSPHLFLWSRDLQARNLNAWQNLDRAAFEAAWTAAGYRVEAFAPFWQGLAALPGPLTLATLAETPLRAAIAPFRAQVGSEPALLTFLSEVRRPDVLRARLANLPGVLYFDQRSFVNAAYAEYRTSSWWLILGGIVAIFAVIGLQYRSWRLTIVSSLPAVIAGMGTLGLLALLGEPLNLLHLVGFVIVLSIGVDYGVYLAETALHQEHEPATALSILLSALSTVLAFGLLGLSHNPALRSIGTTTGIGVLWSLVLAPTLLLVFGPRREADPQ